MPTPLVNFEGISLTHTVPLGQGFIPPDTVGEIGPNHFVQVVNSAFRIYSRSGTPLIPLTSLGTLFSTIPGVCAGSQNGRPAVLYDQFADRWILSEFCLPGGGANAHQLIAVSRTPDPAGAYYLYDFVMPNNKINEFPKLGVWSDAYLMTDIQFNQAGTAFLGVGIFAFDRFKMLAGDPTASFIFFDTCPPCELFGMLPADIDGFAPPPAGAPAPFVQFDADELGETDSLRIFDLHADFAVPANSTFTERAGSPLSVAPFDPREVPSGSRNVIPQPLPGPKVDPVSNRLMFRLAYRNFGTHESLVMNHTVNVAANPTFRAGVRYYEIRRTTPPGPWLVHEQGTMAGGLGDTEHRWMGSTALNGAGSQAVGYSVSSLTVFPSIRYAGRLSSDPPGSLAQGEALLVAGTSSQTFSGGLWGNSSNLTVDPVDDCTFWYTQQYVTGASVPDSTRWHTRVGAFQYGPCPPVQKGILTGTVTSTLGGAAIANATVAVGAFTRNSNASGVYTIDPMMIGTHSVTVSAPGFATSTVPGVTITQGNTTTRNVAITPLNFLNPGTPVITAEGCGGGNNALDPGETVTVNLPIVNNGGAGSTTTNLVATLQAVGGVTSPSGPQNYGAVAQGSPAVVRPFTFTVSAACGDFVAITLQLQDGGTNFGTIVYNLRTGLPGPISTATYSSGNLATPIPDVSTVDIPIAVTSTGLVTDVNVRVRLNHTFDGDVRMSLVAPDNTVVALATNRGGSGANYGSGANSCSGTPAIFDDAAAQAISAGVAPFAGSFRPEAPLSALNGRSTAGTWKLRVDDTAALDLGTIGCVTLEITRQEFVCCGQGRAVSSDFNGDGTGDIAVYRPSTGQWFIRNQGGVQFGDPSDVPVPGDYNGDHLADIAVFRPSTGQWFVRNQFTVQFGDKGDVPVPGDFNGDGVTDVAVYRPSTGDWFVRNQFSVNFGGPGHVPIVGDYNGDGTDDVAVFRRADGMWFVRNQLAFHFGDPGDRPVPGDYDGNGTTDIAVYRPSTGQWFARNQFAVQFGDPGDVPVPRDYNGNGTMDVAIYRPATHQWFVKDQLAVSFGDGRDVPVPLTAWMPLALAGDFDGDGAADIAVHRSATRQWFVRNQLAVQFGDPGDIPVPADYNGDRRMDVAVYRPSSGHWFVRNHPTVQFGDPSDKPVPGDYNGDGLMDVAVFRPSTGFWFVRNQFSVQFSVDSADVPVPGDYNGDGATDLAVFRPSNGQWFVRNVLALQFGDPGDIPVPADYNGDGKMDLAVYRPSTRQWFVRNQFSVQFGDSGDVAVPADYNGDGVTDIAVYRPSTGQWFVRNVLTVSFGDATHVPMVRIGGPQ